MSQIWLHLGLGSFHRAHQAYCFDKLLNLGEKDWQLHAGNIRDDAEWTVEGLLKQNLSYTLEMVSPDGKDELKTIKAFSKIIPFEKGLKPLINEGALADTKLISFTVTEAGYYLDNNLKLLTNNQAIKDDLQGGVSTIYGVIAKILDLRATNGAGALTLLCCDNVRENGHKFRLGLKEFLSLIKREDLIAFLDSSVTTPNTMVDRITPRPAPTLSAEIKKLTGIDDCVPVMSEAFFQWVIEDNFIKGRPSFEKAGAQMVKDVTAYEDAKLRILNATHTLMALLGVIKGYNYVFECARDSEIAKFAFDYVTKSVIPCIKGNGLDLEDYRDTVLERFRNDHIRDTLERICQDSFSKLINFVKPTLTQVYEKGVDPKGVVLIPALYLNFLNLLKDHKVPFNYQDSSFDKAWAQSVTDAQDEVQAFSQTSLLFGSLVENPKFLADLRESFALVQSLK